MNNFKHIIISTLLAMLFITACNRDQISFDAPSKLLKFSKDTVFCDTVYSQTRSVTYVVKVYNDEDKDIKIPHIYLNGGSTSMYRINVDGKAGTYFSNVSLRKKDSLFIFVEIAPVASSSQAIAEDQIIFENPAGKQHVTLFSVVQDAEYFIQSSTNPNIISENTTWTNTKAKLIFGDLTLAEGKTLTIEKGTKVYFHKNSGLAISKNSVLNVNGELGSEVVMRGDRNDTAYDTIPATWKGITFDVGSQLNMNYGKIFGGNTGLDMMQTTANITNSIIHTFDYYGIYSVNSTINANNLVMNNCGNADLGIFKGGTYNIVQSTLANYWNMSTGKENLAIYATNSWTNDSGQTENGDLSLNFKNSIAYNDRANAIVFAPISGQNFNYFIQNCLLKYTSSASGFAFDGNTNVQNSIKSTDNSYPQFENYFIEKMNLRVKNTSPAKAKGNTTVASTVPLDIVKVSRTTNPTIGAYQ